MENLDTFYVNVYTEKDMSFIKESKKKKTESSL